MSAGDAVIKGWQGGSGSYKEGSYDVTYEPGLVDGVHMTCKATRKLRCYTKDASGIIAALSKTTYGLTLKTVSAAGAVQNETLAGYWTLQTVDKSTRGLMSDLNITYTGRVIAALIFGLPANVTFTVASGKAQLKYKGHVLQEWDSGTGATAFGFDILKEDRAYWVQMPAFTSTTQTTGISKERAYMPVLKVVCEKVVMEEHEVPGNNWPRRAISYWGVIGKGYVDEPGADTMAEAAAIMAERMSALYGGIAGEVSPCVKVTEPTPVRDFVPFNG